jgi:hypothetical protein
VALVETDVLEEHVASIIRVKGISMIQVLVTDNFLSSLILFALILEVIRSSKTPLLTRAARRHIPEHNILQ